VRHYIDGGILRGLSQGPTQGSNPTYGTYSTTGQSLHPGAAIQIRVHRSDGTYFDTTSTASLDENRAYYGSVNGWTVELLSAPEATVTPQVTAQQDTLQPTRVLQPTVQRTNGKLTTTTTRTFAPSVAPAASGSHLNLMLLLAVVVLVATHGKS
jgi:hypothetical protein